MIVNFFSLHLIEFRHDRYYMSLDDDVILSPASIVAVVTHGYSTSNAGKAKEENANSEDGREQPQCAVVAPTLSTGIPTVEKFMQDFLSEEDIAEIERCFAGSHPYLSWLHHYGELLLEEGLWIPGGSGIIWNSSAFYARVSGSMMSWLRERTNFRFGGRDVNMIPSVGAGLHPIRWNMTCTELMGVKVLRELRTGRLLADPPTRLEKLVYPSYFCNSAWVATVDLVEAVLLQDAYLTWSHPFDEASMNLYLGDHSDQSTLCIVRGTFGVHPTYEHHSRTQLNLEHDLHKAAAASLDVGAPAPRSSEDKGLLADSAGHRIWQDRVLPEYHQSLVPGGTCTLGKPNGTFSDEALPPVMIFLHVALLEGWKGLVGRMLGRLEASGLLHWPRTQVFVVAVGPSVDDGDTLMVQGAGEELQNLVHSYDSRLTAHLRLKHLPHQLNLFEFPTLLVSGGFALWRASI